jgi:hypothetical protein
MGVYFHSLSLDSRGLRLLLAIVVLQKQSFSLLIIVSKTTKVKLNGS